MEVIGIWVGVIGLLVVVFLGASVVSGVSGVSSDSVVTVVVFDVVGGL